MATVTSTIPAVMDALVDNLLARPLIVSDMVQVTSGPVGISDTAQGESIQLYSVTSAEQKWMMLGNRRREEEYVVQGAIEVHRAGKGEDVIREVRSRSFELLAEIEDMLRLDPDIGGLVLSSELTAYPMDQGATKAGRWCEVAFEVTCKKDLRSS